MIPKGLPGAVNILVLDNSSFAGYGNRNPGAVTGHNNVLRDYSRVFEFDPVSLVIVWQYWYNEAGFIPKMNSHKFYSPLISAAQRLPNGNTMITEGSVGRFFEATTDHEIVWLYISSYFGNDNRGNNVHRAYRAPYAWVPQRDTPEEVAVEPVDVSKFRVTGSEWKEDDSVVEVEGTLATIRLSSALFSSRSRNRNLADLF